MADNYYSKTDHYNQQMLAFHLGYARVEDKRAYGGAYYIKDGKKWIFNATELMRSLQLSNIEELEAYGYAVQDYLIHKDMDHIQLIEIFINPYRDVINSEDCYSGDGDFVAWLMRSIADNDF